MPSIYFIHFITYDYIQANWSFRGTVLVVKQIIQVKNMRKQKARGSGGRRSEFSETLPPGRPKYSTR